MEIGNAITALRAGWVLRDAATWKNRTIAVNALAGLLSVAAAVAKGFGYDLHASDELLGAVAAGVWGVVGLFSAWSTAATSATVGVLPAAPGRRPDDGARPEQ